MVWAAIAVLGVLLCSINANDKEAFIISMLCGIIFLLLAGMGKWYCFIFAILALDIRVFIVHMDFAVFSIKVMAVLFCFFMIFGCIYWKKHTSSEYKEVRRKRLSPNWTIVLVVVFSIASVGAASLFFGNEPQVEYCYELLIVIEFVLGITLCIMRSPAHWIIWLVISIEWMTDYISYVFCVPGWKEANTVMMIFFVVTVIRMYYRWERYSTDQTVVRKFFFNCYHIHDNIRRCEFWLGRLMIIGVDIFVIFRMGFEDAGLVLLIILELIFSIITYLNTIRRLHDAGYSGWFSLFSFVTILAVILLVFLVSPTKDKKVTQTSVQRAG